MIVDPAAREARRQRAARLDPGAQVATGRPEYGDKYAADLRKLLERCRRRAEPVEPAPAVECDAWSEAVRRAGGLIENGHASGNPVTDTP